jgi:hypothetical protein
MPKFICPYHFEECDTRDILFRCINPKCPPEEDPVYTRYWDPKATTNRQLQRIIRPDGSVLNQRAMHAVCPECKMKSTQMICPVCHNFLPHTTGQIKDIMIALIGAKDAGKSVYIAVLINALAHRIGYQLNASLVALNEETIKRYREDFYKPLFEKKELVGATLPSEQRKAQELKHPLMYRFRITQKGFLGKETQNVVTFVFFDTAGEDLNESSIMQREIKYISNAAGIIFLLDPLQIQAVRDQVPKDISLPDVYTNPYDIVSRVIKLIREERQVPEKDKISIPVALAFSKIDAIRSILPPDSVLHQASTHGSEFDVGDSETVHSEMEAYLEGWNSQDLNNIMQQEFREYAFFGFSALGAVPTKERKLTGAVSSFRIEDPFLWILWKNNLIKGRRKK